MTYNPVSTYRVQLSKDFTLRDLRATIPYLKDLGIKTIYASPILKAEEDSRHGYDMTNPHALNPEIGTIEEFESLSELLKRNNMGWLQDIVPNHMAFSYENKWLQDVLEKKENSFYYRFFDINWEHPDPAIKGKIIAPFLGGTLDEILDKEELKLGYDGESFFLSYYENRFTLSARSYVFVLYKLSRKLRLQKAFLDELKNLGASFATLIENFDNNRWTATKTRLSDLYKKNMEVKEAFNDWLEDVNDSAKKLREIIELQNFKLTHWIKSEEQINYRRFFTINGLICLRQEDEFVFDYFHSFLKSLYDRRLIQGLRVDHIDGLFDPANYLVRLRDLFGDQCYIIVEKILGKNEPLPADWPVQGTTGYDFLAKTNQLFTDDQNESEICATYQIITGHKEDFEQIAFKRKYFILRNRMEGELNNLFAYLRYERIIRHEEANPEKYKEALAVLLSSLPVYRIYDTALNLSETSKKILSEAFANAHKHSVGLDDELDFFENFFLGEIKETEARRLFLIRFQQLTAPLAAKGIEDTACFNYFTLLNHNEVGDSPDQLGISSMQFLKDIGKRMNTLLTLNNTATHDTKRGEDARTRLAAISEIPIIWKENVESWFDKFIHSRKGFSPEKKESYFLLQTFLSSHPFKDINQNYIERIKEYIVKALREGKENSNWDEPDTAYEKRFTDFAVELLENERFMDSFHHFFYRISFFGVLKSLSQTILKITLPGIPDIYQGRELWDFSLVDPDNRRPVDYVKRSHMLEELKEGDVEDHVGELFDNYKDGRCKLYITYKLLNFRKSNSQLFEKGDFIPLKISGKDGSSFTGFVRKFKEQWLLVVVPWHVSSLYNELKPLESKTNWEEVKVTLPNGAPALWKNILTGRSLLFRDINVNFDSVSDNFPYIVLSDRTS